MKSKVMIKLEDVVKRFILTKNNKNLLNVFSEGLFFGSSNKLSIVKNSR